MNTEVTQENMIEFEIQDNTYRLEEMRDAISASIKNIDEVIEEQKELIDIVESSEKAEKFASFIEDVKQQIVELNTQRTELYVKSALLGRVVDECKKDETKSQLLSIFMRAMGMFQE